MRFQSIFKVIIVGMLACYSINAIAAKILRVGTTADYPPVTYIDTQTGQYRGTAIKLIENFAHNQGYKIVFVKTTWPTLSRDLLAHRFDIAIGGISKTTQRAKLFLLSLPIGYSEKVPLVRCNEVSKFQTLSDINQPQVTVVENAGGTNASFARSMLPNAHIVIVHNNELPFRYLLQGKADVMITDLTEALYRQEIMPGLCAVESQHFPNNPVAKVALFRKNGTALQKQFNDWLKQTHRN